MFVWLSLSGMLRGLRAAPLLVERDLEFEMIAGRQALDAHALSVLGVGMVVKREKRQEKSHDDERFVKKGPEVELEMSSRCRHEQRTKKIGK